jgi:endonuclease V-like protein UPF0215 family
MPVWFVYFKVPAAERDAYLARAHRLVDHVAVVTGVRGRVMMRSDATDPATLMEVYEGIFDAAAFAAALHEGLVAGGWPEAVRAARRIETFVTD